MFMRFQGGSVGHTFMRVLETWLTETGWGSDITPDVAVPEDDPNLPTTEGQGATTPAEPPSEGSGEEDLDEGYKPGEGGDDKDEEGYGDDEDEEWYGDDEDKEWYGDDEDEEWYGDGEEDAEDGDEEDDLFVDEETLEGEYGFARL